MNRSRQLGAHRRAILGAIFIITSIAIASILPVQGAINFGRWRDINPAQYAASPFSNLHGTYVRSGGTGSIGAGDGWAVGDNGVILHYDGFSWNYLTSPAGTTVNFYGVSFGAPAGAPNAINSPNGDGSDGWIVGGIPGTASAAVALYWDGSGLTQVSSCIGEVFYSVFVAVHFVPGSPSTATDVLLAGTDNAGQGAIWELTGSPKLSPGCVPVQTFAATTAMNSIYMFKDGSSVQHGFAVGNGGIIAWIPPSVAGPWSVQEAPGAVTANDLLSVFVDNGNPFDAWAVGKLGTILWFASGVWAAVSPAACLGPPAFASVALVSTSEGWIVGSTGAIVHGINLGSGNNWGCLAPNASPTNINLNGVSLTGSGNGWAVGDHGVILHYDGSACFGVNPCWGASTSPTVTPSLNSVFETSPSDAWVVGSFDTTAVLSTILHWDGSKWTRPNVGGSFDLFGVGMVSSSEGWAVGNIHATTNPATLHFTGNTWTPQGAPVCVCTLLAVSMLGSGDGWTVGTGGTIAEFHPGPPANWGTVFSPTSNNLNSVFMIDSTHGWAVGDSGTILTYTTPGGWTKVADSVTPLHGVTAALYGVQFKDSQHGAIVGASGTILTTTDGGASWAGGMGQVPGTITLESVFIDAFSPGAGNGDGWAVGFDTGTTNAVFVHWDGNVWNIAPLSPPLKAGAATFGQQLFSVYLTSPTDGFAVGQGPAGGIGTELDGIFHLDPPNPPTQGQTTVSTSVVTVTSSPTSTTSAASSSTSSSISSSSSSSTPVTVPTSTVTTAVTSVVTSVRTSIGATTSPPTTSSLSSSTFAPPQQLPAIPGFPWESIIIGVIVGLTILGIARRRRREQD
ncbi:MAG: YCF48-related protein [Candidatus Bathyarchaeia archaeon]